MSRRATALTVLAALLAGVLWARFWGLVVDDAGISFRYATHVAGGQGLVFNVGERVEGYTNFSWVIALAGLSRIGLELEFAARAMGVVAWACAMYSGFRLSRRLGGESAATLLLLAASPPLVYWAGAGLETLLFAWLWIASRLQLHAVLRGGRSFALVALLVALPLTRPDGVLAVAGALLCGFIASVSSERRRWWWVLGATVGCGGVYAVWKLAYFGDLLPTTYWAKRLPLSVALPPGLRYVVSAFVALPWLPLAVWVGTRSGASAESGDVGESGGAGGRRAVGAGADLAIRRLLAADIVVVALWALWTGGDPFAFYRFFVCVLVPAAVLVGLVVRWVRVPFVALVLLALWTSASAFVGPGYRRAVTGDRIARVGAAVGTWLADRLPADESVAVNASGFLPLSVEREAIDMLGLTDRTIATTPLAAGVEVVRAHARSNAAYVLGRRPGVIVTGNTTGSAGPVYVSDHELWSEPGFARDYVLVELRLSRVWADVGQAVSSAELLGFYLELPKVEGAEIDESSGIAYLRERVGVLTAVDVVAVDTDIRLRVRRDLVPLFVSGTTPAR